MRQAFAAMVVTVLCGSACATLGKVPPDSRLVEAQEALDEGERLHAAGQYAEAVPFVEHALRLRETVLGRAHLEVANCLQLLANTLRLQRAFARAEPLFQRALAIREDVLGKAHPDVANSLRALASLYSSQGLYAKAEPLLQRSLAMEEAALREDYSVADSLRKLAKYDQHFQGHYARAVSLRRYARALRDSPAEHYCRIADSLNGLANLYERQGLQDRAEPLYERARALLEEALDKDSPRVADSFQALAGLYADQGRYNLAVPMMERALKLREAALGQEHPDIATSLHALATLYEEQGHYELARPLIERALNLREETLGKNHPDVADSLHSLAILFDEQGHPASAEPLYERALAIREATLGKNHPSIATSLHDFANLCYLQGHHTRAESLYERAIAIREIALGKNHPDLATSLNSLANLHSSQGLYERARPLIERALAIREAALGKQHPDIADSLNSLANLYYFQGHYTRAEPLYEQALAMREAYLGKNHPDVATSLHNLALLYSSQGLYAQAEPLYQRAIAIEEVAFGSTHPEVATSLNSLANLYASQGLYSRAEPLMQRALKIREEALGQDHPDVADSLNGLANLYASQGLHSRAEPLYARALTIQENALGTHHPDVATSLHNLANLYASQGLHSRAEPLMMRALEIQETILGKDHPDVADSLNSLASLYASQGLYARAEPLHERALAIQEAALGAHHPELATSLHHLARLRLAQQRLSEALPLLERAFTLSEEHLRQEVFGFSEARLAIVLQHLREDEEYLYALARAHPGDARVRHLALSAALLRKGRSVEEIADTSRIIYRGLGQTDRETFKRLRDLRTQLSTLSLTGPGSLSPADYQQRLKDLAVQGDALEAHLARRSAPLRAFNALLPPAQQIARVAAALPQDGALVEFVAYRDRPLFSEPGSPPTQHPSQLRYLAFLLFADGRTHVLDLGPAEIIDRAALRLHHALADRSVSYQPAARALYKLVFHSLAPLLDRQVKRLFVSPDGQLTLVPFATLHDGKRFLVDAFDIVYLTSGKDLMPRPANSSPARSVVVLADPAFGSPSAAPSLATELEPVSAERSALLGHLLSPPRSEHSDQPWPPLPGTRQEAETIHRLLPQAQLLLGADASKKALLELEAPGILHIATHGFFLEDTAGPAATRMVGLFGVLGEASPPRGSPHPLLRSGLVLAGAHVTAARTGSQSREDSLVTALELAGLDLWGTQLVVLSACDTGRGLVMLGQGVYGLRRALMVAGAQTVVASLWKVNDETTRELMEAYYRNLLAGQGRAAALREAMRSLRHKQPHPHFWAPFIAIGQDMPLRGLMPPTSARPAP